MPGLTKNILSVTKLNTMGIKVSFEREEGIELKNPWGIKMVINKDKWCNGMYYLKGDRIGEEAEEEIVLLTELQKEKNSKRNRD